MNTNINTIKTDHDEKLHKSLHKLKFLMNKIDNLSVQFEKVQKDSLFPISQKLDFHIDKSKAEIRIPTYVEHRKT